MNHKISQHVRKHPYTNNTEPINNTNNLLLDNLTALSNSIKQLTQQVKQISNTSNKQSQPINFPYIDQRFEKIKIQIPDLTSYTTKKQKNYKIQEFLGIVCKKIFSIGFAALKNQSMDTNKVKVFCSERILEVVVRLVKKNYLDAYEISYINECFKDKLLPYFQAKYPLSEEAANSNLSNLIIPKNNIDDEENDLVFRSGIQFKLKQSQNYNSEIMKFFNYLITQTCNEKKQFEQNMNTIFEKIFDRNQKIQMQRFDPRNPDQDNQQGIQNFLKEQALIKTKTTIKDQEQQKRKAMQYRQKIMSFTSYKIGTKLSDNLKKFSDQQILSESFELTNPALIRVATKWCEQLEKYYDGDTILSREKAYRMKNNVLRFFDQKWMSIILSGLLKKYYNQYPLSYLKKVQEHSNKMQSAYANQQTPQQLNIYSQQQAVVGNFSVFIFRNCQTYLKGYLNSLIHGIMVATSTFRKIIQYQNSMPEESNETILELVQNFVSNQTQQNLNQITKVTQALEDYQDQNFKFCIPYLITFKIGDLLRCKCQSKQEEIKALYCHIEYTSKYHPQFLEIVRVKNRLEKGTKDILINIMYKQKIVIEMQLAIKADKSKFIKSSSQFSHYLYELQRAQFGPINQMCAIWTVKDERSHFYKDQFDKRNRRNKLQVKQECQHTNFNYVSLPLLCHTCDYYYFDCQSSDEHIFCRQCDKYVCFLCRFDSLNDQEKKKILQLQKSEGQNIQFIYHKGQNDIELLNTIPVECSIINLKKGARKLKKMMKYQNRKHITFLEQKSINKFSLIFQFPKRQIDMESIKNLRSFLMKNVILKKNDDSSSAQVTDKIRKKYIIPKYLQNCFKAQKKSISLAGKKLQTIQIKQKFLQNPKKFVQMLNLSENMISDCSFIQKICKLLPNLQQITISYNKLKTLPSQFGTLAHLKVLKIKFNTIQSLPQQFGKLTNLKYLNIQHNNLKSLPQQFKNLKNLNKLNISNNKLEQIPQQLNDLQSLNHLNICSNPLTSISQSINALKKLEYLKLSYNQIGNIPQQLCQLNKLEFLSLASTLIKKIPQKFDSFTALKHLQLNDNKIFELPESFFKLRQLQNLIISDNRLSYIPEYFGNFLSLKNLTVNSNKLTNIPKQLGNLTSLTNLNLYNNHLPSIPKQIGNLSSLISLELSKNQLTQIPIQLGKLSSLQLLGLAQNKLVNIPQQLGNLRQLTFLSLSMNKDMTELPSCIANLGQLSSLHLEGIRISQLPQGIYSKSFIRLFIQTDFLSDQTKKLLQHKQKKWRIHYVKN